MLKNIFYVKILRKIIRNAIYGCTAFVLTTSQRWNGRMVTVISAKLLANNCKQQENVKV